MKERRSDVAIKPADDLLVSQPERLVVLLDAVAPPAPGLVSPSQLLLLAVSEGTGSEEERRASLIKNALQDS